MKYDKQEINRPIKALLLLAVLSFVAITTFAYKSLASTSELSLPEVKGLVKKGDFSQGFPLVVNEAVVKQLNFLTRTSRGKEISRIAFENQKKYASLISENIQEFGHPPELMAVPFVESRYANLVPAKNPNRAAGVWQFIKGTAINYSLRVDSSIDERLNVALETVAAMRYLGSLNLRFDDWGLALMSYNAGEGRVQRGINQFGSRDPWFLISKGVENDRNYLAKVVAAAILLKYPSLLNH